MYYILPIFLQQSSSGSIRATVDGLEYDDSKPGGNENISYFQKKDWYVVIHELLDRAVASSEGFSRLQCSG